MASIKCAHCKNIHTSVDEVKACAGIVPNPDPFATLARQGYYDNDPELKAAALAQPALPVRINADFGQGDRPAVAVDQSTSGTHVITNHSQPAGPSQRVTQKELPKGKYALAGQDGVVRFYLVDHGSDKGKWKGWVFVSGLVGSPGAWRKITLNRNERDDITRKLAADVQGAAALFGRKYRVCSFCPSPLSKPQSRAAGYGPDCADNHGLPYPSLDEALRVLREWGENESVTA